jgi:hypothetical protein
MLPALQTHAEKVYIHSVGKKRAVYMLKKYVLVWPAACVYCL